MTIMQDAPGTLFAGDSREYRLAEALAEGGEGVVYRIHGRDDVVAKLYKELDYTRDAKLKLLIGLSDRRLRRVTTVPLSRLRDAEDRLVGYVMESLVGWLPLHMAYQARTRLQHAPNWTFAYLLRIGRNLSTCVHHIHEHGLVVGDLNESNVLVGPDAMVKIIDADSFQLRTEDQVYRCKVGRPELLPPELQSRDLQDVVRDASHDRFSLAVLLFQILVFGRHPFAGRPVAEGDVSLEGAITKGWYVFANGVSAHLRPPPHLSLDWLPEPAQNLFERAFCGAPLDRPTAKEWYSALKELETDLATCNSNAGHVFWAGAEECPWCRLEDRWNVVLYRGAAGNVPTLSLDEIWSRIESLPTPTPLHSPAAIRPEEFNRRGWLLKLGGLGNFWPLFLSTVIQLWTQLAGHRVSWITAAMVLLLWLGSLALVRSYRLAWKAVRAAERLNLLGFRWEREASGARYEQRLARLREAYTVLNSPERLESARRGRMRELYHGELLSHLHKYSILGADVELVGKHRLAELQNLGIRTAAQITPDRRIERSPSEDRVWEGLLRWREALTEQFWEAATYALPPHEEAALASQVASRDRRLLKELNLGEAELTELAKDLAKAHEEIARQAEADMKIVRRYGAYAEAARLRSWTAVLGRR